MALIKLDKSILSIRGSYGGIYFTRDLSGQKIHSYPRRVRPYNPSFLGFGTDILSGMSALWHCILLAFFAASWIIFGTVHYFSRDPDDDKKISGFHWYMHYALLFPEQEGFPFWRPPKAPGDLPDSYATFDGYYMYQHTEDEWPDYCPAGYYYLEGVYGGKPYYRTTEPLYWYNWHNGTVWVLTPVLGVEEEYYTYTSTTGERGGYYWNPTQKKRSKVIIVPEGSW